MSDQPREVDVIIVGASLSAAAAAKRTVDAGLETIVLERRQLPRHKVCSGILAPRGHRFLLENFGPLPRDILHEPTSCRGVTFHFPSLISLQMDFHGGPTPHLHRKYSDFWAIQRSGVEVHDETSFLGLVDEGGTVSVRARRGGRNVAYRAKVLIGADGPYSSVIRSVFPSYHKRIAWFMVGQKFHQIESCPLDPQYFHFWLHPNLGHYTWSHARDGRQIVGVGFDVGRNFHEAHLNVVEYLRDKHAVHLKPAEDHEGCSENFGLSLINRYVFGKDRVLITGQAAGFLNMMAEGMSCALHSGAISGEAVIEAFHSNRPVQEIYRKMIASEVRRCSDQWNPLMIALRNPHEADFKAALGRLTKTQQLTVLREMLSFIRIYAKFKWGRQILGQAVARLFLGHYPASRWI
ncbi:MAG: FAD-dependent monooxygenase [Acidobacteriota bacterium]